MEKYDFSLIKSITGEILSLRSTFSTNQKVIDKLTNARNALKNAKMSMTNKERHVHIVIQNLLIQLY